MYVIDGACTGTLFSERHVNGDELTMWHISSCCIFLLQLPPSRTDIDGKIRQVAKQAGQLGESSTKPLTCQPSRIYDLPG